MSGNPRTVTDSRPHVARSRALARPAGHDLHVSSGRDCISGSMSSSSQSDTQLQPIYSRSVLVVRQGSGVAEGLALTRALGIADRDVHLICMLAGSELDSELVLGHQKWLDDALGAMTAKVEWLACVPESDRSALLEMVAEADCELVVVAGGGLFDSSMMLVREILEADYAVALAGREVPESISGVAIMSMDEERHAIAAANHLSGRLSARRSCHFMSEDPVSENLAAEIRAALGFAADVAFTHIDWWPTTRRRQLELYFSEHGIGLMVWAVSPMAGAWRAAQLRLEFDWGTSPAPAALLLPFSDDAARARRLEASDAVAVGGRLRALVQFAGHSGGLSVVDNEAVVVLEAGRSPRELAIEGGILELQAGVASPMLGVAWPENPTQSTTMFALRGVDGRPHVLIDAALEPDSIAAGDLSAAFVLRLDRQSSMAELRRRWSGRGVDAIFDASSILGDGAPPDLPDEAARARMGRVARRLVLEGHHITKIHAGPLGAPHMDATAPVIAPRAAVHAEGSVECELAQEITALTGAQSARMLEPKLILDNAQARRELLEQIAKAQSSVEVQAYIVDEDPVAAAILAALRAAGERGVAVRVIVDSLLSRHRSFGWTHPLLAELENAAHVELVSYRPVDSLPGFVELKQRDHRKLVIVDGRWATLSGRNLGKSYYTGFSEVQLTPETISDAVPWLDASVSTRGPMVDALRAMFRSQFVASGGRDYDLDRVEHEQGDARAIEAQLIEHRGLEDAHTVDLYRAIFDAAQQHIYVVNTFPLQLELRKALLRALQRGVTVRYLVGHIRPVYAKGRAFAGGAAREVATQLVFGRLDRIVREGADVRAYGTMLDSWSAQLERVYPHVHAKVVSVDGRVATVGSANLDITAGYWENEAVIAVHDTQTVAGWEQQLEALFDNAEPVRSSVLSSETGRRYRGILARYWPSLIG